MLLSCGFSHRIDFHLSRVSYSCGILSRSGVHPPSYAPCILPHKLLSCTILLACLTPIPPFFKQSFMVSIPFFRSLSTELLPAHYHTKKPLINPVILYSLHIGEHPHRSFCPFLSSFCTTSLSMHLGLYPFS